MKGHRLEESVENALIKYPRLRQEYQRPATSTDRLYRAHVLHIARENEGYMTACDDDESKLILRNARSATDDNPAVHYGLIASANQLMQNAQLRDKLSRERDVLCFEMEAAGLMNHFPCLVIRGICDYSDTHKNLAWQGYAAMTAAAYANDVLSVIPPTDVAKTRTVEETIRGTSG